MSNKGANLELKNEDYEKAIRENRKDISRLEAFIIKLEGRINMQTELMKKLRHRSKK